MAAIQIRDVQIHGVPWELKDLVRLHKLLQYFQSKTTDVEINTLVNDDGSLCLQYRLDNIRSRFYEKVCVREVLHILGGSTTTITSMPVSYDDVNETYPKVIINLKIPTYAIWQMYNEASVVQVIDLLGIKLAGKLFDLIVDVEALRRFKIAPRETP